MEIMIDEEMNKVRWDIIAKHLNGELLNEEEQNYIDNGIKNGQLKQLIEDSSETLINVERYYQLRKFDTNAAWNKVNRQTGAKQSFIKLYRQSLKYAAIFIIILATSAIAYWQFDQSKYQRISVSKNESQCHEYSLPDGSIVILNRGTKLKYQKNFDKDQRVVTLTGEAFFKVKPDQNRPFIVETRHASVKVLGTSFNVFAYQNEPIVEVLVETGKVNMSSKRGIDTSVLLTAGEKGIFDKNNMNLTKATVNSENRLAWVSRQILFRGSTLNEVIKTLEQTFNLNIIVDHQVNLEQEITATFYQQEPNYILDVVALTLNLDISTTGKNTYLIRNK